jgi:bacterioferritin-associated ferredoxin
MAIDRCVCFNVTFAELKLYAQDHQCGLDELKQRFGCGRGCAMCVPYIRVTLQTGQVEFPPDFCPPMTG